MTEEWINAGFLLFYTLGMFGLLVYLWKTDD